MTYGLWLDHKGKAQADSFLLRLGENEFLAVSPHSDGDSTRRHLEKYIVADEVSVSDETGAWIGCGAWGKGSESILAAHGLAVPGAGEYSRNGSRLGFRGRRSVAPNFEVLMPRSEEGGAGGGAPGGEQVDQSRLELERIRSGIPAVPDDIGPGELPNEGGLDAAAISYTKGCFTGQEVMARLKNMGQVRRRLFVVRGEGDPPPPRSALHQDGVRIGETRTSARDGGGFVAFALLSLVNLRREAGLSLAPDGNAAMRIVGHG